MGKRIDDYESAWLEGRPTWREILGMLFVLVLIVLAGSVAPVGH